MLQGGAARCLTQQHGPTQHRRRGVQVVCVLPRLDQCLRPERILVLAALFVDCFHLSYGFNVHRAMAIYVACICDISIQVRGPSQIRHGSSRGIWAGVRALHPVFNGDSQYSGCYTVPAATRQLSVLTQSVSPLPHKGTHFGAVLSRHMVP